MKRARSLVLLPAYLIALLLFLAAALTGSGMLGFRTIPVQTPLLRPFAAEGSVLLEEPVRPEELRPGDMVTFTADANPGSVLTQRVTAVERRDAAFQLTTLPPGGPQEPRLWLVHPNQPVGRVIAVLPLAGYVLQVVERPPAVIAAIAAGLGLLALRHVTSPSQLETGPR